MAVFEYGLLDLEEHTETHALKDTYTKRHIHIYTATAAFTQTRTHTQHTWYSLSSANSEPSSPGCTSLPPSDLSSPMSPGIAASGEQSGWWIEQN